MEEQNQDIVEENQGTEDAVHDGSVVDEKDIESTRPDSQVAGAEPKPALSTGRRVWLWTAIVISVLVLILAVGGIVGTWVTRGVAIDVVNGLMDGIDQLAGAGRDGTALVGSRVDELRTTVGEVQSAADEIAQNVSDQGLILTLLPPEKEQELVARADRIRETADSILAAIDAALNLYTTVDNIPLVSLPRPDEEKLQQVQSDIQAVQAGVDQLTTDIQQFRDDAAAQVGRVSNAAGQVDALLGEAEDTLSEVDSELSRVQTRAQEFASGFASIATLAAILVTLILAWIIYALANLVYSHWQELHP